MLDEEVAPSPNIVSLPLLKSDWAEDFAVPWYKMPENLLQAFDEKQRPSREDRRTLVKIVTDSIREITPKPGKQALCIICKNIVQKYPESLSDALCGEVVGQGYDSLLKQILTKLENDRREIYQNTFIESKYNKNFCSAFDVPNKIISQASVNSQLPSTASDESTAIQESKIELESDRMQQLNKGQEINNLIESGDINLLQGESCSSYPKVQKIASSQKTNLLSVDPNWAVKFAIPWYKMSNAFLHTLTEGKRPSPAEKRHMIRNILDSIQIVNPNPKKKALDVVCRKIVEKYPDSLSDIINGEIVRGSYSSILKIMIVRLENLKRKTGYYKKKIIKSPCGKGGVNAVDESSSANMSEGKSYSGVSEVQDSTSSQNIELVVENWVVNFDIPWNKMPKKLLHALAKKQRPTPSDRHNLIRIIINSIQKIIQKPKKGELSIICKNIVQKYPESFCDALHGEIVGEGYTSLLRQMVTRVENINRKSVFNKNKQNRKLREKTNVPNKLSVTDNCTSVPMHPPRVPPNQSEETQEFEKEREEGHICVQPVNQTYEHPLDELDQEDMLLDESSSDAIKVITSCHSTESLPLVTPDWEKNFVVPWNQMPIHLLGILSSKRRPSPTDRRKIIRIICNSIREINPKPRMKELSVICRNIVQKYPESFHDTLCGETVAEGYSSLLNQMVARCENLNRISIFDRNQQSREPCEKTVPKNTTNIDSYCGIELKPCVVLLNRSEPEHVQQLNEDSEVNLKDESDQLIELDEDSCSGVAKGQENPNWAENFTIPWNKMPEKLFCRLTEKQRLSRSEKLNAIRFICDSIQKITVKPGKEALSVICKNIVQKYPESFNDTLPEEACSSILKQMEKRFDNLNTEIIYFKEDPDTIPLDDSEDEDWSNTINSPGNESSSESEEEEQRKCQTTGLTTGVKTANNTSCQDTELSPSWAEDFSIPWNKLPDEILSALSAKERPSVSERRKMIRIISNSIAEINPKPGVAALSIICRNIVKTYPESFKDILFGEVIGEGYSSVLLQMERRFNSLIKKSNNVSKNMQPGSEIFNDENETQTSSSEEHEAEHVMKQLTNKPKVSLVNESGQTGVLQADECNLFPYVDPHWEEKFVIPWSKMPEKLLYALEEKKRPCPMDRKHMINIICDAIREITLKPGRKALTVICKNIVEKYPESFSDAWCGVITSDSFSSLLKQMTSKFCTFNKELDPFRMIAASRKSIGSSTSKNVRSSEYYGCINWQPLCLPENESEETQKLKKGEMWSLFQQGLESLDIIYCKKLLMDTFFSLRKDINNGYPIDFLFKEWPLLFVKEGLLYHFKMLVGVYALDKLKAAHSSKGPLIFSFLVTKPVGCDKKMMIDALEEINKEKDSTARDKLPNFAVVINLLMSYFGEVKELLFLSVDVNSTVDQIENMLKNKPANMNSPCLICCGSTMWSSKSYMLSIDSTVVNDDIKCFEDGLAMLFASFFIFNLEYPKLAGATLEFIQRCFLGINPSKGTKVERAKSGPNPKVMKLINNINDFRWHAHV